MANVVASDEATPLWSEQSKSPPAIKNRLKTQDFPLPSLRVCRRGSPEKNRDDGLSKSQSVID